MSLKITVEVDGQSEQQLAPGMGQWVARHSEWLKAQGKAAAPPDSSGFYRKNSALLQQQIQQLMAQNQRLQEQVSQSQRLLAGIPDPKALLPQAADANRALTASAVAVSRDDSKVPPPLPAQYQSGKAAITRYRLKHSLVRLPLSLWRLLIWVAFGKEWLLLFLLFCGGMYGTLTLAPRIAERLWPPPEFVDSADDAPGTVMTPKPQTASPEPEKAPATAQPVSPTSKAGSHPPPPPAFQQP